MNDWIQSAMHAYARLAPRERALLQGAVALTLLTILFLTVSSYRSAKADLRAKITAKHRQLDEVQQLRRTYLRLKQQAETLTTTYGQRPESFSLFSYLDGVGKKTVSREKILAMSPSSKTIGDQYVEEAVEMKLANVTLPQVLELLHQIETAPTPLLVSRLQMKKRYDDPYEFEVTLVVTSLTEA